MKTAGWLDNLRAERTAWWTAGAGILVCAVAGLLILPSLPPVIPIFYSLPWGEDQLGTGSVSLLIIAGAVILFGLNSVLARRYMRVDVFLGRVLVWSSVLLTGLLLLTLIRVWLLFL